MNGTSYIWTGPLTCERDHSLLDKTRRLSVYKWRPHSHLTVYSHEEVQITRRGPRAANTNLWTGSLRVTGSSTCERDMYMWTGPVLVKDPPPVNETSTCEWNEMSTCEWIFDKRLKFHRWFLHVLILTRHKENYTCRLKLNLVRLSAVRLTVMAFSFWQDYIDILRGFAEYNTS